MSNSNIRVWLSDKNLDKHPNADDQGVYVIRAVHPDGSPRTLNRVAGKDPDGILYIGETHDQTLFVRICDFRKAIDPQYQSDNHSGGRAYNASEALQVIIKPQDMAVELIPAENPKKEQDKRLTDYRGRFGELPPLNSQG